MIDSILRTVPLLVAIGLILGAGYLGYSMDVQSRENFCAEHDMKYQDSRCVDGEGNKYFIDNQRVLVKDE